MLPLSVPWKAPLSVPLYNRRAGVCWSKQLVGTTSTAPARSPGGTALGTTITTGLDYVEERVSGGVGC